MQMEHPGRLTDYFWLEKRDLLLVSATGIFYNVGMTAGPFFEGRLAQCLYDITRGQKTAGDMAALAALYIGVILLVQGCRALKRFYVRRFANNTSRNMRTMLYNSIVHMDKAELDGQQLGSVMTKAIGDVDACVEGMRKFTTELFDTGVVILAYAALLCAYDLPLALLSSAFIPAAYFIAGRCRGPVTRSNEVYKNRAGQLNQATLDLVGHAVTYRVFGLERQRAAAYEKNLGAYETSAVRANLWESALQPLYHILAMCGAVLIFWLGGRNVQGTGWAVWDIGAFTTFFSCFAKLALKSSKAAKLFNAVQKASVSWKRIRPMFRDYQPSEPAPAPVPTHLLKADHARVAYPGGNAVLHDISFCAVQGQCIGVTGAIACGKTALGKAFIGEAEAQGITLDGIPLSALPVRERCARVGYLGHEPELLSADLAENILLAPPAEVPDGPQRVRTALEQVCMAAEADAMPQKTATQVGEEGARLSGGQQARLALARCLAHEKGLLILDDPFSAVDKDTEQKIWAGLRAGAPGRITLLLSHRLSLFPQMDGVLYLREGTAAFGTHAELLRTQPGYAALFALQGGEPNA